MRFEYDRASDTAYISLLDADGPEVSMALPLGILRLDFDFQQRIVGIEVESASQVLPLELLQGKL